MTRIKRRGIGMMIKQSSDSTDNSTHKQRPAGINDKYLMKPKPGIINSSNIYIYSHTSIIFILCINVLLVDKDISVACLALLHIDNGLVGILEGNLLNPGLDLLVDGKLEHLVNICR